MNQPASLKVCNAYEFALNQKLRILGSTIRIRREHLSLSQEALAEQCRLHRTYVCDIERGARNITIASLLKLASGLQTTVSELTQNLETQIVPREDTKVPASESYLTNQKIREKFFRANVRAVA